MGLYDELNKINRSILTEKQEKAEINRLKELERIKKQEEKENIQFLNDKIQEIIKKRIKKQCGESLDELYKFYRLSHKNDFIKNIIANKAHYSLSIYGNCEIEDTIEKYYYKTINNYKKELQYNQESIKHIETIENMSNDYSYPELFNNIQKRKPFIDSLGWLHILNKILK